jgi:carboxylate-amine ligase
MDENLALTSPFIEPAKILATGTGADRQLKVFEETKGDLRAVFDYMVQETAAGLE